MSPDAPWSIPEVLPATTAADSSPALAVIGEIPHLVWSRDSLLYHSFRSPVGWSEPARVTGGIQPAVVAGRDGHLHCVFANEFMGNTEIYYIAFDGSALPLPVNVSHTGAASVDPSLGGSPDGTLHTVWADSLPGRDLIYYGRRGDAFWTSEPISGARGEKPAIGVTSGGMLFAAWQQRSDANGLYDIFCSALPAGDAQWSIPVNVSVGTGDSTLASIAITAPDTCHLVWQEEQNGLHQIFYSNHRPNGWSQPEMISGGAADCQTPHLACSPENYVEAIWLEGDGLVHRVRPPAYDATWWAPEPITAGPAAPHQPAIAISPRGKVHLAWSAVDGSTAGSLYYARRQPISNHPLFFPVMTRSAPRV
jgi:hypothetical protein